MKIKIATIDDYNYQYFKQNAQLSEVNTNVKNPKETLNF